ncbi:MAG TPA: hypothetical protein VMM60_04400, partial [Ilumatobacter sp.]|nr:hypothetical protein [Ilumatobacter sp.]
MDDLLTRLSGFGESLERTLSDVRLDEVRGVDAQRPVVLPNPGGSRDSSMRRVRWQLMAAAAAVALIVGGLVVVRNARSGTQIANEPGQPALGSTLAEQLVGRTWVAVDYPLPTLPVMRFGRGDRGNQVTVDANDTCNSSSGVMSFDGDTVFESEVMSTGAGCGNPTVAPFANGTTFRLVGDEVTVENTGFGIGATRYVAIDSLAPLPPENLPGEYLYGATPLRITDDEFVIDGCTFSWTS